MNGYVKAAILCLSFIAAPTICQAAHWGHGGGGGGHGFHGGGGGGGYYHGGGHGWYGGGIVVAPGFGYGYGYPDDYDYGYYGGGYYSDVSNCGYNQWGEYVCVDDSDY